MNKKLGLAILITLFFGAYGSNALGLSTMMESDGMTGNINIPGDQPLLEDGSQKYVQGHKQAKITCTQCHTLPNPNQHSSVEWPNIIVRMKGHIKTYNKNMPSDREMQSIIKYYVGNSK